MLAGWKLQYLEDIRLYILNQSLVFNLSYFIFLKGKWVLQIGGGQRKQDIDKDANVLEAVGMCPAGSVPWWSCLQANWLMK